MADQAHWLFEFDDQSLLVWTGAGELTLAGKTYVGVGGLASVSPVAAEAGEPERRVAITLSAILPADRRLWLQDVGPKRVTLRQVYGRDDADGNTVWRLVPRAYRGRLSAPRLQGGEYTIEIVSRIEDIDRGVPFFWSSSSQQRRHPGDLGFEHLETIGDGVEIRWPP